MSVEKISALTLNELKEYARFQPTEQDYISHALAYHDDPSHLSDPVQNHFRILNEISKRIPDGEPPYSEASAVFHGRLLRCTNFDLDPSAPKPELSGQILSFDAYRFLYERLLGARIRPFLVSAFCGAAALPNLHPKLRLALLQSVSEAAAFAPGWSIKETVFRPQLDVAREPAPATPAPR